MADSSSLEKLCFDLDICEAKLSKWKVKTGSHISQGTVLLLYDDGSSVVKKWKAPRDGTVTELVAKEGDILNNGCVLMSLMGCLHPVIMKDMCADCGADLRESKDERKESFASVSMVHSVPELRVSKEQAQMLGRADEQRLLKSRKLVLLVDLDQTLIHTTNDDVPNNLKDVHHFQLYGAQSPWYHARLRPGTKEFLDKVGRLFELHICTFGARLYAHTIANILDGDGRYFSHRILSRDECFSANSKTANLKALFPCGDNMVVIIDDREDVWNFAPNVVHVKPYHFFQHTGDINAPPGMTKTESDSDTNTNDKATTGAGRYLLGKRIKRISKRSAATTKSTTTDKLVVVSAATLPDPTTGQTPVHQTDPGQLNQDKDINLDQEKDTDLNQEKETNPNQKKYTNLDQKIDINLDQEKDINLDHEKGINLDHEKDTDLNQEKDTNLDLEKDTNLNPEKDINLDQETDTNLDDKNKLSPEPITLDEEEVKVDPEIDIDPRELKPDDKMDLDEEITSLVNDQNGVPVHDPTDGANQDDIDLEGLPGHVKVSATTTTIPEALEDTSKVEVATLPPDHPTPETPHISDELSSDEGDIIEVEDTDDYLLYLSDILTNIHQRFYTIYDTVLTEGGDAIPDMKDVIPRVRRRILKGVHLVFSGVIPTNVRMEKCRAYYLAKSMGAEIQPVLVVGGQNATTHMVAARIGTVKVTEARRVRGLHIVTPDWLWSCAERWERVEEAMFPLTKETSGRDTGIRQQFLIRNPGGAASSGPAARIADAPSVAEAFPTYDPVTGKRTNAVLRAKMPSRDPVPDAVQDAGSTAGPSSAPPTFADSIPQMMTLSKEDIENMDREVEDLLDDSDDSDEKIDDTELGGMPAKLRRANSRGSTSSSSNESLSGDNPRGWKRKAGVKRRAAPTACMGGGGSGDSGSGSPPKFPRSELPEDSDRSAAEGSDSTDGESVGSVDDEMAAAVEREFLRM